MTELATPPAEQAQEIKRISHWIGGRTVEGTSGRSGPVYNPALGKQTGAVDFASPEEIDAAVQAAKAAFSAWRATSLSKKSGEVPSRFSKATLTGPEALRPPRLPFSHHNMAPRLAEIAVAAVPMFNVADWSLASNCG